MAETIRTRSRARSPQVARAIGKPTSARGASVVRRSLGLALFVPFVVACASSNYTPARSPRIAIVDDQGTLTLVRDGESYPAGFSGSGVVDAVHGNPVAEEYAHTYKNRMVTGWIVYGVGVGALLTGTGLALRPNGDHPALPAAIALAGVVGIVTGAALLVSGQPYLWDAVNTYNDGVDARQRYALPAFAQPPYSGSAPPAVPYAPSVPYPAPVAPPPPPAVVPPASTSTPPTEPVPSAAPSTEPVRTMPPLEGR